MTLSSGTRLGPSEILAPIGSGGMGEVYRARDARLARDVAIKVLPAHLSRDPDLRARFEREARAVAALNHPHICVIHDVGREGDTDFLVMELVEGETLAERLTKGALPVAAMLKAAVEIAGALDRAHRAGIVHRDLKPGNVMLTKAGAKLMDFGLARGASVGGGTLDTTQSPSMTRPLTAQGSIIGTLQYMAPEQLEGKDADARSDLWALGCVLYETATGKRAFEGTTSASVISSIMRDEPRAMSELTPLAPPALERIVRRCLAKDPDDRWQTARDLMHELGWIARSGTTDGAATAATAATASFAPFPGGPPATALTPLPPRRGPHPAWIAVAAAAGAAIAAILVPLTRQTPPPPAIRFSVARQPEMTSMTWPVLSPDGSMIAFLASDSSGTNRIWVRPIRSLNATPLAGTEGAGRPFWSPDSRQLAYFTGQQLKKVPTGGGPPQLICEVRGGADGSWGSRDVILFDGGQGDSIRQVSASGGVASAATTIDRTRDAFHSWPCFLPDGERFLYVADGIRRGDPALRVGRIGSTEDKIVGTVGGRTLYAHPGYVLYCADQTLMARPFDAKRLEFTGEPFPVAEKIETQSSSQTVFSVSQTGALAFLPTGMSERASFLWVDRAGKELGALSPPGIYRDFDISPDGTRVVYGALDPQTRNQDIWVWDIRRSVATKLTFDPEAEEIWPVWSPDGLRIAYSSDASGVYAILQLPSSGGGRPDSVYRGKGPSGPVGWSGSGRCLTITSFETTAGDVCIVSPDEPRPIEPYVNTDFHESNARISPDGRWIAYSSDESGRAEVYVQSFPEHGGKWQVSTQGGDQPAWRADGKEVFYLSRGGEVTAVPVTTGTTFEAGIPEPLFTRRLTRGPILRNRFAPAPDGQRFLLNVPLESAAPQTFTVVMGWPSEVEKK